MFVGGGGVGGGGGGQKIQVSLAMNVFICSVKSYSEVSSRDHLVTSDKQVRLLYGSWFRTHQNHMHAWCTYSTSTSHVHCVRVENVSRPKNRIANSACTVKYR